MSLAPAAGQTGVSTITLTVSDGVKTSATAFTLTVAATVAGNTAPTVQAIASEVELALDNATLTLTDHKLVNLRVIFSNVARNKPTENFGAVVRFRAATEPL